MTFSSLFSFFSKTLTSDPIVGTVADDHLVGLRRADIINAGAGDDVVSGRKGSDKILGEDGNDRLSGGSGRDTLDGGDGNDTLDGGSGRDYLTGGAGEDLLDGGSGRDMLYGGQGNDHLSGGAGRDQLHGGAGDDLLEGGSGRDYLEGGNGVDTLIGGKGKDTFVFSGDPFHGGTPGAPAPGLILGVNNPDQVEDFSIAKDKLALVSDDFGVDSFAFVNGLAGDISGDATFIVVQDEFENARAAAQAIADNDALVADEGFFVYFNATLGINRLVFSEDLGDGGAFSVLANLNNLTGEDAIAALPDFTAENFALV